MTDHHIAAKVAASSRGDLAVAWMRVYRSPPPPGFSRRLLEHAAAWHGQAARHGGLKPATRRRLARHAGALEPESRASGAAESRKPAPVLPAGTRLVRDWRGQTHTVDVAEGGFLYRGRIYGTLSEVARRITGARWSGPRFFGVRVSVRSGP